MKKIILFLTLIAMCSKISAQNDTLKLSLASALKLGLSNRFDAKESSLNIDIAKNKLAKSNKELLPDLSASGKINYFGQVQPSIIPAGYLGLTEPEKITIGMKNNTALALDLNYTIYKPGLFTDIKIAANDVELAKEKNVKSDIDIKIEIAQAYDNALLKSLQYSIAQKNENRYKEYYTLANGKYLNGALLESDMLLAELDYKNAVASTTKQKQNYMLSLQSLIYYINVPENTFIVITDSLPSTIDTTINTGLSTKAISNRSEIKQMNIEQAGYVLQLKKTKENYYPSLSFFANYTKLFQGPDLDYSQNFYWAPVNCVGLKLSVPIIGSIKNINAVKEYKLKLSQTDLALKQKTADLLYEVQSALTKLNNTKQNLIVAKDNYQLSQKVYELNKQQYNTGDFSNQKLLDTEKSLSTAEQDYITAVYEFLIAKINYQKAVGSF